MTTPRHDDPEALESAGLMRGRARDAMGPWIAGLASWDWYATLTYDPKRSPNSDKPPSEYTCARQFSKWLTDIYEYNRTFVVAAGALEYHKSGWPHWHALVKTGSIPLNGVKGLFSPWYRLHGYARIQVVGQAGTLPIADYVSKYLVKEGATGIIDWRPKALAFGAIQPYAIRASLRQARLGEAIQKEHKHGGRGYLATVPHRPE